MSTNHEQMSREAVHGPFPVGWEHGSAKTPHARSLQSQAQAKFSASVAPRVLPAGPQGAFGEMWLHGGCMGTGSMVQLQDWGCSGPCSAPPHGDCSSKQWALPFCLSPQKAARGTGESFPRAQPRMDSMDRVGRSSRGNPADGAHLCSKTSRVQPAGQTHPAVPPCSLKKEEHHGDEPQRGWQAGQHRGSWWLVPAAAGLGPALITEPPVHGGAAGQPRTIERDGDKPSTQSEGLCRA